MAKTIKESVEKIREECDNIAEAIEPKKGTIMGDPVVMLG
jgi:hypothetical protein